MKNLIKHNKLNFILIAILGVVLVLPILWWGFPDWFHITIFPVLSQILGRITSFFQFSVGEFMLICAVLLVITYLSILFASIFLKKLRPIRSFLTKQYIHIFLIVLIIMELNCFLLYQTSKIPVNSVETNREYGFGELSILRNYLVEQANLNSGRMVRDNQGEIIDSCDIKNKAKESLKKLSYQYPQLKGFYVDPKPLYFSDFFSQQYILGYFFPFSMEANYNQNIYIVNMPVTMCHELAHTKGFIREDEANFLAFLACIHSEEVLFNYSGYLSVLGYVDQDFYRELGQNLEEYQKYPPILDQVREDDIFIEEEIWLKIEKNAYFSTDFLKDASKSFTDTTLKLNGVSEGIVSYSKVVLLLLEYYDGILY